MKLVGNNLSDYKTKNYVICDIDKSIISAYECVSFIIKIVNRDDDTIYDINLRNIFSESFSYVLKSFSINGIYINDNVNIKSINIDEMFKDEEIIIRFTLKAITSFNKEVIKTVFSYSNDYYSNYRKSEIIYSYIDERQDIKISKSNIRKKENKDIKFQCNKENLKIIETLSKRDVLIGEIVSFNLNIKNTSNTLIENFEVINLLDESLELITDEVFVENKKIDSYKLITGIKLGDIRAFSEVNIRFKAKVLKKASNNIKNIIRVNYKDGNNSYLKEKISCNELKAYCIDIAMVKSADKEKVILGDEIVFKLNIKNLGDVDYYNVNIYDDLPENLEFIKGSIYIGSCNIKQANIKNGINIATIKSGEDINIYYKVMVKKIGGSGRITSTVSGSFKYKYGEKRLLKEKEIDKLIYSIRGENPIFTEFNLESYINIENSNNIKDIIDVTSSVDINESYVIKTVKGITSDNLVLTGYKMIVNGILNVNLEYSSGEIEEKSYICIHKEKFLVDIMLPEDYNNLSSIDIKESSSVIYSKIIGDKRVLCISSIFIEGILFN